MPRFDKTQIKELKDYLYQSNIHDARMKDSCYDRGKKMLSINVINPIHNVKMKFIFCDVKAMLSISGNELGSSETVNCLIVEEDFSFMQNSLSEYDMNFDESLYLLLQMFSGDELHVVCGEVVVEEIDAEGTITHENVYSNGQ